MSRPPRDRVTVDLRGIGPELQAQAAVRGRTVAAMVRGAVAMLGLPGCDMVPSKSLRRLDIRTVKVTLRVSAVHSAQLAERARSADVSQGAYLAGLLDGKAPGPESGDHGDAIASLADSTQRVAAMSADIHAFIRSVRDATSDEAQMYRMGLTTLSEDVRLHLQVASRLVADLARTRPIRSSRS